MTGLPLKAILDSDIFLVSYPRSGSTWLRNIIAEIVYGESGNTLGDIEKYIPDIHRTNIDQIPLKSPRIIKSHFHYDPKYRKVIYIVRDPRDVYLSFFKFKLRQHKFNSLFTDFILDLNSGKVWPGKWNDHVHSWLFGYSFFSNKTKPDLFMLRYEDTLSDTKQIITLLSEFLGYKLNSKTLNAIIDRSSKEKMKEKQSLGGFPFHPKNFPFIDNANSGYWRKELTEKHLRLIISENKAVMKKINYL